MDRPEFPKDFLPHCYKVQVAKEWHKRLDRMDRFDPEDWCECEFHKAGAGLECQCGMFLTRPFNGHQLDEEFLPKLEKFYADMVQWEREQKMQQIDIKSHAIQVVNVLPDDKELARQVLEEVLEQFDKQ